ncbi:MAG: 2-dehydropantoate 2-reductase [Gammaproteobacteria bacterium]|nr:2-dehydropantoate 2-reductase [Gammaproteobacteria bacterium]
MKICVYGAGAIGGFLGGQLARAGVDVTLIARGPHLAAMQASGLTLQLACEQVNVKVRASDDTRAIGPQDAVVLALKAHSVSPALDHIRPLLGPETAVVTAQNGILWWYFHRHPGPLAEHRLEFADPGGRIRDTLGAERAIGCVVYPSCEIVAPGVVRHIEGNRFMLGEPDGSKSARVQALSEAFGAAGMKAPVRTKIRDDIWFKLLGNATFNPVSVLTGATLGRMGSDAGGREVIRTLMREAEAVATALGVEFPMSLEKRIDGATAVGDHKTSMLQDLEAGRPLELDALVGSVTELGRLVNVPTPALDLVLALVRLRLASAARPVN